MSSLRQHFQHIKEIVDWSWTLALLCLFGYITLGQLAQLYWAMIVLGGVAGSFGLFYEFSCQKLAELDSLEVYELQKANVSAYKAEILVNKFADRNPRLTYQNSNFAQAVQKIGNLRTTYYVRVQERVKSKGQVVQQKQTKPYSQESTSSKESSRQKQTKPYFQESTSPKESSRQKPSQLRQKLPRQQQTRTASQSTLTEAQYKSISNQGDYQYVKAYVRNGKLVSGYYRRKPQKKHEK